MNKHVSSLCKVASALALLACNTATFANDDKTFNVGDLSLMPAYTQQVQHVPGSFSDIFNFSLPAPSDVTSGNVILNLTFGSFNLYKIDNPMMALYDALNPNVALVAGANNLEAVGLSFGNYFVKVQGEATGSLGGTYLFGLAALPVPEPEQWMLFAAGVLAVGSMARRRIGH